MKIKNSLVIDEQFVRYFSELMIVSMPAKKCIEVSKAIDVLSEHYNVLVQSRKDIANKYCKMDEKGKPLVEKGNLVFENETLKEKFSQELKDLDDKDFELPISETIKIGNDVIMTPLKVKLLKGIIEITD